MAIQKGETILDKYRIIRSLGGGGMAHVWLAEEINFRNLPVAIKEMRHDLPPSELSKAERSFYQERDVYAKLEEWGAPNVVGISTVEPFEGSFVIVMTYMSGGDLNEKTRENASGMSIDDALPIIQSILEALASVHNHPLDIVHRDIKPSNILFDATGMAYLADFGVAQWGLTMADMVGEEAHPMNPGYAPPEQMESSAPLDPSADVYSLGCVIFELLTGKKIGSKRPGTSPRELNAEIPDWLAEITLCATAQDRYERYVDAGEMLRAFHEGNNASAENERKNADEEARLAQQRRQEEEEAQRLAEIEAQHAEERRLAEEQRLAAEAKLAEEKRRADELNLVGDREKRIQEMAAAIVADHHLARQKESAREEEIRREVEVEAYRVAEQMIQEEEEARRAAELEAQHALERLETEEKERRRVEAELKKKTAAEKRARKKEKADAAREADEKSKSDAKRKDEVKRKEDKRLREERTKAEAKQKAEQADRRRRQALELQRQTNRKYWRRGVVAFVIISAIMLGFRYDRFDTNTIRYQLLNALEDAGVDLPMGDIQEFLELFE